MISICDLSYMMNNFTLLTIPSFTAFPRSIIKIIGNNGSGKTTFLRMLAGIIKPKTGKIISNFDSTYIGHELGIKDELTVSEQLLFWANIENNMMLMPAAIAVLKLEEILDVFCYKLSAGNKQKLALAKLLLSNNDLWLLDEIDTALDEANLEILHNIITTKANHGGIVCFSSHSNILPHSFVVDLGK